MQRPDENIRPGTIQIPGAVRAAPDRTVHFLFMPRGRAGIGSVQPKAGKEPLGAGYASKYWG